MTAVPFDEGTARAEYHFECADHPDPFHVVAFEAHEGLNEPYRASVVLRAELEVSDAHELLGRDVRLTIAAAGSERQLHGVVDRVTTGDERHGWNTCTLHVVPALAALDRTLDTRIFQDKTALEIVTLVLREGLGPYRRGLDVTAVDAGRLLARNYCVQYRETNLAFVHRLLEEEGIGYYFDHAGPYERLVLFDHNAFSALASPIELVDSNGAWDKLVSFTASSKRISDKLTVRDYDWRRAGRGQLEAATTVVSTERHSHEVYEHGIGRHHVIHEDSSLLGTMAETLASTLVPSHVPIAIAARVEDLDGSLFEPFSASNTEDRARVRREALGRDARTFEGLSCVMALGAGSAFTLAGHPAPGLDGDYFVTRIRHSSEPPSAASELLRHTGYHNRLQCLRRATPWRPDLVTLKPSIASVQLATVTGPPAQDVYTDAYGRIQVRFPWQREAPNPMGDTCWLRVSQAWAGPTAPAFLFIPRIGMEVLVAFVDGDPDRPLVVGCVHNGENVPPALLPAHATKSVIRTRSVPFGAGYNELSFEDAMGMERVYLRAERDLSELVQHDHDVQIEHDETISIGGRQVQEIGASRYSKIVGTDRRAVGGNNIDTTLGNDTRSVGGTAHLNVARGYHLSAGAGLSTFAPHGEWTAEARGLTLIAGSSTLRMTDREILRDHENEKGLTLQSFGSTVHITQDRIELKVGESSIVVTPELVQINGKTLPINKE